MKFSNKSTSALLAKYATNVQSFCFMDKIYPSYGLQQHDASLSKQFNVLNLKKAWLKPAVSRGHHVYLTLATFQWQAESSIPPKHRITELLLHQQSHFYFLQPAPFFWSNNYNYKRTSVSNPILHDKLVLAFRDIINYKNSLSCLIKENKIISVT